MTPNNSELIVNNDLLKNDELQTTSNNTEDILLNTIIYESQPITMNNTNEIQPITANNTNEIQPITANNTNDSQPIKSNNTEEILLPVIETHIISNNTDEIVLDVSSIINYTHPVTSNNVDVIVNLPPTTSNNELSTSNNTDAVLNLSAVSSNNTAKVSSTNELSTSNNTDAVLNLTAVSSNNTAKVSSTNEVKTSNNTDAVLNLSAESSNNTGKVLSTNEVKTSNNTDVVNGKTKKHYQLSTFNQSDVAIQKARDSDLQRNVSWGWPYVFLIIGVITYYLIQMNYDSLPAPVTELQIKENPRLFSGQRSAAILKNITSFGERVVGSVANEVLTPKLITDILEDIQFNRHSSQNIQYEIQTGSGAFNLNTSKTFTSVYQKVHNVVAKLHGSGSNYTMLINCHFDSVPSSLGASDDATSCAVMLEILRALSSSRRRLRNDIIFLFNGAEEPFLCGAHLFLQHRWSADLYAFINMEGMGGGGKPLLFQASPRAEWLFNYYGKFAPYPHSQVFADEIFESGVIPSDTDYTVFQDFKHIAGLDFAFIRNGYIHHSKYDTEEYVSTSSHQVYGENIMETVKGYGNAGKPDNLDLYDSMVFCDYLGWFMIFYTKYTGTFINLFVTLASLVSVGTFSYRSFTIREILFSTLASLCGILLGVGLSALVGLLMDGVTPLSMSFYYNSFLIFPLYWFPCFIGCCLPPYFMDMWRLKKNGFHLTRHTQLNVVSNQIPWAVVLFILTAMGIRTAQVLCISLIFTSSVNFFIHLIKPLYKTTFLWMWLYLVMNIPPLLYQIYVSMLGYTILVPMLGRSGPINADLVIALVSALLALLVTSSVLPLMTLVRGRVYFLCALCLATVVAILLAALTQLGMPYHKGPSNPAPQRFFIMHTERNYFTQDNILRKSVSGYVLLNIDRNTLRTLPEHLTNNMTTLQDEAKDEMHSNFITRLSTYGSSSTWIPALQDTPHPQLPETLSLNVRHKICDTSTLCTVVLEIRGADRMTVFFTPKPGITLTSWSVPAEIISYDSWEGRPTYFIFIIMGELSTYSVQLHFTVTRNVKADPLMDVGLAGYATHHPELRSEEFKGFIADLPEYSTVTGWNCIYKQFII